MGQPASFRSSLRVIAWLLMASICLAVDPRILDAQPKDAFDLLADRVAPRLQGTPARLLLLGITDADGAITGLERYLTDKLAAALTSSGRVILTSEAARQAALAEIKANLADVIDTRTAQAAGRIAGAPWILKGTAYRRSTAPLVEIQLQLVRSETAEYWQVGGSVPIDQALLRRRAETVLKPPAAPARPPLRLEMAVVASRRAGRGADQFLGAVRDGDRLRSNDDVKVHFRINADAYVYLIWVDPRGQASLQFPSREAGRDNRVQGGRRYSAPQADTDWYYLDRTPGVETLYLVASYERMSDLEGLLRQVAAAGGRPAGASDELDRLFDDLRARGVGGVREGPSLSVPTRSADAAASAEFGVVEGYSQAIRRLRFQHDP